jgi:aldose sugar dehydrogenase
MKQIHLFIIIACITFSACAQQTESEIKAESPKDLNYTTELVVPDLNIPWGMTFLPDGSMLITEKSGELIHF